MRGEEGSFGTQGSSLARADTVYLQAVECAARPTWAASKSGSGLRHPSDAIARPPPAVDSQAKQRGTFEERPTNSRERGAGSSRACLCSRIRRKGMHGVAGTQQNAIARRGWSQPRRQRVGMRQRRMAPLQWKMRLLQWASVQPISHSFDRGSSSVASSSGSSTS